MNATETDLEVLLGEEEETLEYQSAFQGFLNELIEAGNDEAAAESLACRLALKTLTGESFTDAETNALLGIESAIDV
jgi:hypothetical protein